MASQCTREFFRSLFRRLLRPARKEIPLHCLLRQRILLTVSRCRCCGEELRQRPWHERRVLVAMVKTLGRRRPCILCESCGHRVIQKVVDSSAEYYVWDWLVRLPPSWKAHMESCSEILRTTDLPDGDLSPGKPSRYAPLRWICEPGETSWPRPIQVRQALPTPGRASIWMIVR